MASIYPNGEDVFPRKSDVSLVTLPLLNQYDALLVAGDYPGAITYKTANPSINDCLLDAKSYNDLCDALENIESFFLSEIQPWIMNVAVNKGDYATGVYNRYEVVTYNGLSYQAFPPVGTTQVPSNKPPTDTAYWKCITLQGEKGDSGVGLSIRGGWSSLIAYTTDDAVAYNNAFWYAKQNSTGQTPNVPSDYWGYLFAIPQQITTNANQPTQNPEDYWFQSISNGRFIIWHKKTSDGLYEPMYPKTYADNVYFTNDTTLQAKFDQWNNTVISATNCTKATTIFTLTLPADTTLSTIFTVRFKAPADYVAGDTFVIGSTTYIPVNVSFKSGNVVILHFDSTIGVWQCYMNLPIATSTTVGAVKSGLGNTIASDGAILGGVIVGSSAPTGNANVIWVDSDDSRPYWWNGSAWALIKPYTYGTAVPTGGNDGDVYFQYT